MAFRQKEHSIGSYRPSSVAIQGQLASFSHETVMEFWGEFPDEAVTCCDDFNTPFEKVMSGEVDVAVVPYRNTIAGNVPYVHNLLGQNKLSIIGEFNLAVRFHLLTVPEAKIEDVREVHSHSHALAQCSKYIDSHVIPKWTRVVNPDTGGAAKLIAELNDPSKAAIASALAAQKYGLHKASWDVHQKNNSNPITRFFVFAQDKNIPELVDDERPPRMRFLTTLYLKPKRNVDRAEFEIAKRFAEILSDRHEPTLDEFIGNDFRHEGYSCEFMGHVEEKKVKTLISRLGEICSEVGVIGCYKAHHFHRFPKRAGPQLADGSFRYGMPKVA